MSPAARIPMTLWEREKEHIRALYLDKDKTLNELVKCMSEEHGFYATRSQYIRRLDNWGMRKNSTKAEWEYAGSLVRKRKSEGKESEIIMGGKPVSAKKLKKELGRYVQSRSLDQPCSIPPSDVLDIIIARTPPAIRSFDPKFIACTTVPWFRFLNAFIPMVISAFGHMGEGNALQLTLANQASSLSRGILRRHPNASTAAKEVTEGLPKNLDGNPMKTQSPAQDLFMQILCWAVHRSSNNLLSDSQTDNFLQWIINHGNIRLLRQFTCINNPVIKVLMANLLLSAIRLGNEETVSILLKRGAKPNIIHRFSRVTILQLAVRGKEKPGSAKIVQLLLEHGACPNTICPETKEKRSPLCLAMMDLPRKSKIAEMLIRAGADVNISYRDTKHLAIYKTPLIAAAAQESSHLTRLLLEKGADPDVFLPDSKSALHAAAQNNCVTSAKALLRAGANANVPYGEGYQTNLNDILEHFAQDSSHDAQDLLLTPIDVAHKQHNRKIIKLLRQANAHADGCLAFVANWNRSIGYLALQDAARRGKHYPVMSLLAAGVDVNTPPSHGARRTALQAAAESGNIGMVQLLLDRGASVNTPPHESGGLTALQAAISSGVSDLIELLMQQGGNTNAEAARYGGRTCLEAAVSTGNIGLVDTLLSMGADVNPTCSYKGKSSIFQTALIVLIKFIADLNQDCRETSALTRSISQQDVRLFNLLMSRGAKPDLPQDFPTPLLAAIENGSFIMARRLIEAGADVNRPSPVGDARLNPSSLQTPLQAAIKLGDNQLISLLIDSRANINYSHNYMRLSAALDTAISYRNREAVRLLLSHGADPDITMSLSTAIPKKRSPVDLEIYRMLISHEAQVNPRPWGASPSQSATEIKELSLTMAAYGPRLTPLQAALERGHEELASMLLEAGADFNAPISCEGGKTALQAAAWSGNFSFVEQLISRGVDVNAPPAMEHGATALQFAAMRGHYNVVVFLIENGADVNAPKAVVGGRNALEAAADYGRLDIVHLLLENDQDEESLRRRCQDAAVFAEIHGHYVIAEILRGWKKH